MAVTALRGSLGLFLVAPPALDVERINLCTGHGGIVGFGILAVTFETALDSILPLGCVMADRAVVVLGMSLMGKDHGRFLVHGPVDGHLCGSVTVSGYDKCRRYKHHG